MNAFKIAPIGIVKNDFKEPASHHEIKKCQSIILLDEKYVEALMNIENCEFIDIVFYFHQSESGSLLVQIPSGEARGVFASRSPRRPNLIGVTTVKLIKKEENRLYVTGLDAINDTPVIDIKCCDTSILEMKNGKNEVHNTILKLEPRLEINNLIAQNDLKQLLIKAGQLHGHLCPGLAMGVMAATFAMNEMKARCDCTEDLLAIIETNNCFLDGIQFVTGCSFGNNKLIYNDLGKTAFTLISKSGNGIRICSKHESQEIIKNKLQVCNAFDPFAKQDFQPENISKLKKATIECAFETLKMDFETLFNFQLVQNTVPSYEKSNESVVCSECSESVLKHRTRKIDNNSLLSD